MIEVQVVAAVAAGGVMRVHVEGVGDFEVTVPPGVVVGQPFVVEIDAPLNTTVECVLKAGAVAKLVVTPASRRADVTVAPLQG